MPQTQFFGSQVGGGTVINYSYTDMPWKLVFWDFWYFLKYAPYLPWVVWPLWPCYDGRFDELSFTFPHIWCVFVHIILVILQVAFLLALPSVFILPGWLFISGLITFFVVNQLICRTLNGCTIQYTSEPRYSPNWEKYEHEQWIFLNGISVGEAWLKGNLNRLALTFGRPVIGIHNRTNGVIFDVLEAIVQRCFGYATTDIRLAYKILKGKLYNPQYTTVVFILHSQGGIEGGLVLDWLLQEVPQDLLAKLEVYTFGNAANHFNNPHRHKKSQEAQVKNPRVLNRIFEQFPHLPGETDKTAAKKNSDNAQLRTLVPSDQGSGETEPHAAALDRAIGHIEHYAHTTDFVALWGVLHFITNTPASPEIPHFVGRLFAHESLGGHLLNQHYLNDMFPLAKNSSGEFTGCAESNEFMDSVINPPGQGEGDNLFQAIREGLDHSFAALDRIALAESDVSVQGKLAEEVSALDGPVRVRDLSRLWHYRNGQTPGSLRKV